MSFVSTLKSSSVGQKVILPVWRSVYARKNWIYRNPLLFPAARREHFKRYNQDPSLTNMKEELAILQRDGVIAIPGFFDEETTRRMVSEVEPALEQLKAGTFTGKNRTLREERYGVYRMWDIDTICPATRALFDHAGIESLARAYISKDATSYQKMGELRPDPKRVSIADHPHIDDWKMRFKSFLYLTDVGPEQAPFRYFVRSHRDAPWRRTLEARYYREGSNGGYLNERERSFVPQMYEEKIFTGKAGTLILADLRGLHRGTPLVHGKRITLVNYFGVHS